MSLKENQTDSEKILFTTSAKKIIMNWDGELLHLLSMG